MDYGFDGMQLDYTFPTQLKRFFRKQRPPRNEMHNLPPTGWIVLLVTTMAVLFFLQVLLSAKPPVFSINEAYQQLSDAQHVGADEYAPQLFQQAQVSWDSLFTVWRRENKRLQMGRDYGHVLRLAEITRKNAQAAKIQTLQVQDSLRSAVNVASLLLRQKIADFKLKYSQIPMDRNALRRFSEGELLLNESSEALKRGNYFQAAQAVKLAESKISSVDEQAEALLNSYLRQLPVWRSWAAETVEWSEENDRRAILINKLNRQLQVYEDGQVVGEFAVEFGPHWLGAKRCAGDGATPEGKYFVIRKKEKEQTKYYLALEIDYPNERDRELFERAKQKGEVAPDASIGGLIEIHGAGGRGRNWTEGCVALNNRDMERLYGLADVGTMVTIVGSLNGVKKQNGRIVRK